MTYWQHVQSAAGMATHYPWVLLGCIVGALVLHAWKPGNNRRLRAAVVLVLISFVGMLVCGLLTYRQMLDESSVGYRTFHCISQLCLGLAICNIGAVLLFRVLLPMVRLEPAPIVRDTLLGLVYIGLAFVLLGRHDVNLSGIVATSAVVTAVIGFSLQDTLGNIMGGAALQLEHTIAAGDWIRLGDVEGLVREIRWRHASIETRNGDTVVIPNSVLMKSQVTVLGRRAGKPKIHRMWVTFNVDFRHAPATVVEIIERALRSEPITNIATDPPPDCVLQDFKESYGAYAVRYWLTDFAKDTPTSSEVRTRIFFALQRAGIAMSMPAEHVFMTMEGRSRSKQKQEEELNKRIVALGQVAVFTPLSANERAEVAARLTPAPFRKGEVITRQGNEAHYLYLIHKGEVKVVVASNGSSREVATLKAGQVVGEMGLLTGEPRTATVIASTDVVCYMLEKDAFKDVLQRRPEIAEAIAHLLAERKLDLDAKTEGLRLESIRNRLPQAENDLLQKIKKFFTLS